LPGSSSPKVLTDWKCSDGTEGSFEFALLMNIRCFMPNCSAVRRFVSLSSPSIVFEGSNEIFSCSLPQKATSYFGRPRSCAETIESK